MSVALLDRASALLLLEPYLADIRACQDEAYARFQRERAQLGPVSATTRACTVHDYILELAERFDGRSGVRIVRRGDGRIEALIVEDQIVLRFKKLDEQKHIQCIPTGRARAWADQQPLDGFPESTYLVAGYVLDELNEISGLHIVCARHGQVMWHINLDDVDGVMTPVLDLDPSGGDPPRRTTVSSERDAAADGAEVGEAQGSDRDG